MKTADLSELMGKLTIRGADTGYTLPCDALAVAGQDVIVVLSVIGPQTAIKAIGAALRSNAKVEFGVQDCPIWVHRPKRHPDGYRVWRTRLHQDYDLWHLVAVANEQSLLLTSDDETIWRALRSDRYTTPVLRPWVPWVREQFKEAGKLTELRSYGCEACLLVTDNEDLDDLVSEGLRRGSLKVRKHA